MEVVAMTVVKLLRKIRKQNFKTDTLGRLIITDQDILKMISGALKHETAVPLTDETCGKNWQCADSSCESILG